MQLMQRLCHINDINEGAAKAFNMFDFYIFAVKKQGQIYVYKNSCPHLGVELEYEEDNFLDKSGKYIECATHGALFLIDSGHCISGPCKGGSLSAMQITVNDDGDVYLHPPKKIIFEDTIVSS